MAREIKRTDLVSQFEGVVKQEIKNFNDTTVAFSFAISDLQNDVIDIKEKIKTFIPNYDARHNALVSEFNEHENKIEEVLNRQKLLVDSLDFRISRFRDLLKNLADKHEGLFVKDSVFGDEMRHWSEVIDSLRNEMGAKHEQFVVMASKLRGEFSEDSRKIREEIQSIPDNCPSLRAEMEDKILVASVEKEGLTKEIRSYKKRLFIAEKNIENLYSLLDILKARSNK